MRIVLIYQKKLPAVQYGGTERIVWWLGRELARRGHRVVLLAGAGTECAFADVRILDPRASIDAQLPADTDLVHFHIPFTGPLSKPFLVTIHWNGPPGQTHDRNAVFISRDHAARFGSSTWVYNGIDPADYGKPALEAARSYFHFLGKAAWRRKNVRGAIRIARRARVPLRVLGGHRLNFNMGFRLTLDRNVSFAGMVGGEEKNRELRGSRGLIFPVLWQEPFGLAVVESLYFGCPVIATPYGALPELVPPVVGYLSDRLDDLVRAVHDSAALRPRDCHDWMMDNFTATRMTDDYLRLYERVLAGEALNREPPVAQASPPCTLA
jgi:glycosyltransferase involved in cell wall biosynthesis